MSRPDKSTAERHTRLLRDLVKRPENKLCADCKHNDPRWASWNLGVFLCIRCSGIHRGMGTHISKIKSVDLDMWTAEQMDSILKWGNRRANLYWEARLKAGHVPPDHKMESFIRSKYESRRWAMDGPPPSDPSILDDGSESNVSEPPPVQQQAPSSNHAQRPGHQSNMSRGRVPTPVLTTSQPQPHQLLSTAIADRTQQGRGGTIVAPTQAPAPQPKAPENDLFSLDFHAPPSKVADVAEPKKDVKNDILSLFSTAASPPHQSTTFGQMGGMVPQQQQNPWGQFGGVAQPQQTQHVQTNLMGSNASGQWGGWNAPAQAIPTSQGNVWASKPPPQPAAFGTSDIWASTAPAATGLGNSGDLFSTPFASTAGTQKKDDAFGDLWGGFK